MALSHWRLTISPCTNPCRPCRRGIDAVPTFYISCGSSKEVQMVGAESVKAFEVAFRKVGCF